MRKTIWAAIIAAAVSVPANAVAGPIVVDAVPSCDNFGAVPSETFGGSGISNTSVCWGSAGGLTIRLSAGNRFANAALTDDGAGTFTAQAGGDVLDGAPNLTRWNDNFAFYNDSNNLVTLELFVDTANGAGTTQADMAVVRFAIGPGSSFLNSYNPAFDFLRDGAFPFVTGSGDQILVNNNGNFGLVGQFRNVNGDLLLREAIQINAVNGRDTNPTPVPEPASMSLLGLGLAGVGFYRRRRKNA